MIDATERKQLEGERDRLLESREEMLAGLSTIAHDLRNPLAVLALQVDRLLHAVHGMPAETQLPTVASSISRSMASMTGLIDTALDIAQLSAGRLPLRLCEVDLCQVIQEAVADCKEDLARSASTLSVSAGPSLLGHWDPVRVRQLAVNLLSNAIKYGRGKPIEVSVEERCGAARLTVRDHGIGIADQERELIFEKFQRTASGQQASRGFGVGLWLVRRICEALGGSVSVSSTPAEGSTFVVELPLSR
jgi:signal transduction histidine kinase